MVFTVISKQVHDAINITLVVSGIKLLHYLFGCFSCCCNIRSRHMTLQYTGSCMEPCNCQPAQFQFSLRAALLPPYAALACTILLKLDHQQRCCYSLLCAICLQTDPKRQCRHVRTSCLQYIACTAWTTSQVVFLLASVRFKSPTSWHLQHTAMAGAC